VKARVNEGQILNEMKSMLKKYKSKSTNTHIESNAYKKTNRTKTILGID
jgi:hypothetical protein